MLALLCVKLPLRRERTELERSGAMHRHENSLHVGCSPSLFTEAILRQRCFQSSTKCSVLSDNRPRRGSASIRILYTYVTSSGDIRYDNRSYAVVVQWCQTADSVPSCVHADMRTTYPSRCTYFGWLRVHTRPLLLLPLVCENAVKAGSVCIGNFVWPYLLNPTTYGHGIGEIQAPVGCYQDQTCTRLKICFLKILTWWGDITIRFGAVSPMKLPMFCGFGAWVTWSNRISWTLPPVDMRLEPLDVCKSIVTSPSDMELWAREINHLYDFGAHGLICVTVSRQPFPLQTRNLYIGYSKDWSL